MKVQDIITLALKYIGVLGVGLTAQAEDSNDAFTILNMMLTEWQTQRWLVYALVDSAVTSAGALSYTVGIGGTFNIYRPDRLEAAFFRQVINSNPSNIDYPVQLLQAREDYNRFSLKSLETFPQYVFYDAAYPLGNVFFWPVPPAGLYELHITTKTALAAFTGLTETFNLPDNYQATVVYNLAARLRPMYGLPPDPSLTTLAAGALQVLRNSNAQVPRLQMPADLKKGGQYNVFSDQVN